MRPLFLVLAILVASAAFCQESKLVEHLTRFPSKFIDEVNSKTTRLEEKLITSTQKYLQRQAKLEARLKRKLQRIDSTAAKNIFSTRIPNNSSISGSAYLPFVDSLKTSLSFLQEHNDVIAAGGATTGKIKDALANIQQLQSKFRDAEQVKQFIKQRRQQLKEALSKYTQLPKSLSKEWERYNAAAYYYAQQVNEYKELFNDPGKLEQKALELLNKLPAFQQFMREHSELAGLFSVPGNYGTAQSIAGLQTRTQVQQLIQTQLSGAGPNLPAGQAGVQQLLQQNIQAAQAQLSQLKDKINKLGGSEEADLELPGNFKPNNQKTKSFWKRLEYGSNLQSVKSNYFFPTTTDIGLSVGYKLNDKSVIGIGASYKMGWGKDIRHIDITHEGMGLRSFIDWKLKGSFYASGGFEYNYQQPGIAISSTAGVQPWQQSGLIGMSKIVSLGSKVFKKTKLQLLWDFLSYQQTPRSQAMKFRVGYNF